MKEFSYEEAKQMLGACALASVEVISYPEGKSSGKVAVWKSLLADFWVKANVSDEVMCGDLPVQKKTETPSSPITGNGYFGH